MYLISLLKNHRRS